MTTLEDALAYSSHQIVPYPPVEKRDIKDEMYCIQREDKHKQSTSSSAYSNNSHDSTTVRFEPVVHTVEHARLTDADYRSILLPRWATVAARRADGVSLEQEQKAWRRELRQWGDKGVGLVQKRRESEWEILRAGCAGDDEGCGEMWTGDRCSSNNKRRVSRGVAESVKKVKRSFGSFSESVKEFFLRKDSGGSASSAGSGRYYARGEDGFVGDKNVKFALEPVSLISTPSSTGSLNLAAFWSSRVSAGEQSPMTSLPTASFACAKDDMQVDGEGDNVTMTMLDARGLSPLDTSPLPDQSQINELTGKLAQAVINASNERVFDDGRRLNHLATGEDVRRHRDSDAWEASRSLRELVRSEARERNRAFRLWDGESIRTPRRGSSVDDLMSETLCRRLSRSRTTGRGNRLRRSLTGFPRQRVEVMPPVDVFWRSDDNLCRPSLLQ